MSTGELPGRCSGPAQQSLPPSETENGAQAGSYQEAGPINDGRADGIQGTKETNKIYITTGRML